jgi:hypothetical protein
MRSACQDEGVASSLPGDQPAVGLLLGQQRTRRVRDGRGRSGRHTVAGTLTTRQSDGYPSSVCSSSREPYAPAMALAYRSELVMAFPHVPGPGFPGSASASKSPRAVSHAPVWLRGPRRGGCGACSGRDARSAPGLDRTGRRHLAIGSSDQARHPRPPSQPVNWLTREARHDRLSDPADTLSGPATGGITAPGHVPVIPAGALRPNEIAGTSVPARG